MSKPPLDPLKALRQQAEALIRELGDRAPPSREMHRKPLAPLTAASLGQRTPDHHQFNCDACADDFIFQALPMPALVMSESGRVLRANAATAELLGQEDRLENVGSPRLAVWFLHALQPEDRRGVLAAVRKAADGENATLEAVRLGMPPHDQGTFDIQLRFIDQQGLPEGRVLVLLIACDASHAQHHSHHLVSRIAESSDDHIYAADLQGRILYANPRVLRLIGRPASEVIGKRRESFLPLRDALAHANADQQVIATGLPCHFHDRLHGPDGVREFSTHRFPIRDASGRIIGVAGNSRDVTQEYEATQLQRMSEAVFRNTREAIVLTNTQGEILRVNPGWERLTGFSAEVAVGRRMNVLHSGTHDDAFYREMWQSIYREGHWSGEMTNRRADGTSVVVWTTVSALFDDQGRLDGYMAVQTDLTELRHAHDKILLLATTDPLTGLPNRALFNDRLQQAVLLAQRQKTQFALLFADLDHFKEINDSLGHEAGDIVLKCVADRLRSTLRAHDTVARLGGDEFVVLLPNINRDKAMAMAERALQSVQAPMSLLNLPAYQPQASVGLVVYPDDGDSADALLRRADQAMYSAKRSGRNRLVGYTAQMETDSQRNFSMHVELRHGIAHGELRLYLQPKFRMTDLQIVGAEALVRWAHPRLGLIPPGDFLPLAQQHNLMVAIDDWVFDSVLTQVAAWHVAACWPEGWRISVNKNADAVRRSGWTQTLANRIHQFALPPDCIEIELTEELWAKPDTDTLDNLRELKSIGVQLSIDDFGTGYSSLSYLSQLPASVLKIDRSFIMGMLEGDSDRMLVQGIVELARKLGYDLVAEGVETEAQRQFLAEIGCSTGQGYLVSPPVPVDAFAKQHLGFIQPPSPSESP